MTLEEIAKQLEKISELMDNGYTYSAKQAIERLAYEIKNYA